ncbi:MAG: hypothetical protein D6731_05290 [Planctomycetota bacterium]|nr:MAG: hypothetical protein D6731_05290 [Planctomycetota bacterium]
MRTAARSVCVLVVFLAVGCPRPAPPPSPAGDPKEGPGSGRDGTEGNGVGRKGGHDGAGAGGASAPGAADWRMIPDELRDAVYPTLQPLASWPAPAALRPFAKLASEERPSGARVRQLEQLVGQIVHPEFRPHDFEAALGTDASGRLHVRLGRQRSRGSASAEVAPEGSPFSLFAFAVEWGDPVTDLAALRAAVAEVVAPPLARELAREEHRLVAHPVVRQGGHLAAMAMLDRAGFGMQFPYLYAYAGEGRLLVVCQEVPHLGGPPVRRE